MSARRSSLFHYVLPACFAGAALLIGCGGGGGGSTAPQSSGSRAGSANGSATIAIPSRTAAGTARAGRSVSAAAVSVSISVNNGAPSIADISSTSSACTSTSTGRTCTVPLSAPPGNDTFVFKLYDQPNASGNLLNQGQVVSNVAAGQPFTVAATLDAAVSSIAVSLGNATPVTGVPATYTVVVTAKDPSGNAVVGGGNYMTPITLSLADPNNALTLSATSVTGPGSVVQVTYNGTAMKSPAQITAVAPGISASAITNASVIALDYHPSTVGNASTLTQTFPSDVIVQTTGDPRATQDPSPYTYTSSIQAVGASFNGIANATQTRILEPSTFDGFTATYQEDDFASFIPTTIGADYQYLGDNYRYQDSSGNGQSGTSFEPMFIQNRFAALSGQTWVNDLTVTDNENDTYPGGGYVYSLVRKSDGTRTVTYNYQATTPVDGNVVQSVEQINPDSSMSFTRTYRVGGSESYAIAAPAGASQLQITYTRSAPLPNPTATVFTVANWYPNGNPPPVKANTNTQQVGASIPAQCGLSLTLPSTAAGDRHHVDVHVPVLALRRDLLVLDGDIHGSRIRRCLRHHDVQRPPVVLPHVWRTGGSAERKQPAVLLGDVTLAHRESHRSHGAHQPHAAESQQKQPGSSFPGSEHRAEPGVDRVVRGPSFRSPQTVISRETPAFSRLVIAIEHVHRVRYVPGVNVVVRDGIPRMAVRLPPNIDVIDVIPGERLQLLVPALALREQCLVDHDLGEDRFAAVPTVNRSERFVLVAHIVVAHRRNTPKPRLGIRGNPARMRRAGLHHHLHDCRRHPGRHWTLLRGCRACEQHDEKGSTRSHQESAQERSSVRSLRPRFPDLWTTVSVFPPVGDCGDRL